MPRSTQSVESKILTYFKTAPLAAVSIVLGLAKEVVKDRQPKEKVVKKRHRRTKAEMAAAAASTETTTPLPEPKKTGAGVKKSHHKQKPRHSKPVIADEAELDDLRDR